MRDFWASLFWALFIALLFVIFSKEEIDDIVKVRIEKAALLREKRRLLKENREKEMLRAYLEKRLRSRLYPGYTLLLMVFIGMSCGFSIIFFEGSDIGSIIKSLGITHGIIYVTTLFIYRAPKDLKFVLTEVAPFLKKRIYGDHVNIESEIENNLVKIQEIDLQLEVLDRKLAFA